MPLPSPAALRQHVSLGAYLELTKPRIVTMVLVTTGLGYLLGTQAVGGRMGLPFLLTLLGTALSAAGSSVLNQYLERDVDARMRRTRHRPLPTGRVSPSAALSFGFLLILGGQVVLALTVNLLTAWLALLTAFLYVVVYTPLKRLTWLNTSLGSIPGALPPVGGWAAATGGLDAGAWALFAILFAWQHPHFYSIAWTYRQDYRRGGFQMLPLVDADGRRTCRHIIAFSGVLLAVSTLPTLLGMSGYVYLAGALLLGAGMLTAGVALWQTHALADARRLLRASIIYLPVLLVLTVIDSL